MAPAMAMPEQERVRLARELIAGLDEEVDREAEVLWLAEAERRREELRSAKRTVCRRRKPLRGSAKALRR